MAQAFRPNLPCAGLLRNRLSAVVLLLATALPAAAAEWVETPFNPPVGSRWIISSNQDDVEERGADTRRTMIKTKVELTIDEKIATGYRITYVTRELVIDGNAPGVAIAGPALGVIRDLVIRAKLDAKGKPVEIENLEETKASLKVTVDRMAGAFADKPQMAAAMRSLLTQFMVLDGVEAAEMYLDQLTPLIVGHNTGLKAGETRSTSAAKPNPFGGTPIKSNAVLRIVRADANTGNTTIVSNEKLDPEALKEIALQLGKRILAAAGSDAKGLTPTDLERIMRMVELVSEDQTQFEVEKGMTRLLTQSSTMRMSAQGHTLVKRGSRVITVTPAP